MELVINLPATEIQKIQLFVRNTINVLSTGSCHWNKNLWAAMRVLGKGGGIYIYLPVLVSLAFKVVHVYPDLTVGPVIFTAFFCIGYSKFFLPKKIEITFWGSEQALA